MLTIQNPLNIIPGGTQVEGGFTKLTAEDQLLYNAVNALETSKETPTGAQTKATTALTTANTYTDTQISGIPAQVIIATNQATIATNKTIETTAQALIATTKASEALSSKNTAAISETNAANSAVQAALASGSPKGIYATLSSLQAAYPTGNTGIYLVAADGKWYYWTTIWTAGGVYQSTGFADNSITHAKMATAYLKAMLTDGTVTISINQKTIIFAGTPRILTVRGIFSPAATTINYTDDGYNYIFYNLSTNSFVLADNSNISTIITDKNNALLFMLLYGRVYADNLRFYMVDNVPNGGTPVALKRSVIIAGVVTIINSSTKTIDIAKKDGGPLYVMTERGIRSGLPTTLSFTNEGFNYIYFDITTYDFSIADVSNILTYLGNVNKSLVAVILYDKVYMAENLSFYTINGVSNGGWVILDGSTYDTVQARIVMPDKLYLVKDVPYAINGVNVVSPLRDFDSYKVSLELPLLSKVAKDSSNIDLLVSEECTLNTQLTVFSKGYTTALFKNLAIKVKNKANIVNPSTPSRVLCIGDSLTSSGLPASVKWWLNKWGITSEMIGTINNNYDYGYPFPGLPTGVDTLGEGRGGWWLTDYTGGLNYVSGGLCMRDGNPFWNPSTQAFDAAYYLSHAGKSGFDFVTIGLGVNDISGSHVLNTAGTPVTIPTFVQVLAYFPAKLDLMIASLKAVNPSVKIAIIPPPIVGSNATFGEQYRQLTDVLITHYAGREDVVILGTYMSVGLYASPTYVDLTRTVVSAVNNSMRGAVSGGVHIGGHTQISNACWIASWIANML